MTSKHRPNLTAHIGVLRGKYKIGMIYVYATDAKISMPHHLDEVATSQLLAEFRFQQLASVPAEVEWLANIGNAQTRRAYKADLADFSACVGLTKSADFQSVTRAHVIAWRYSLEARQQSGATIRRKLAALSSLFDHLCERHVVSLNPVRGTKRPKVESQEGKTPALSNEQARALLAAPDGQTLKGKRDRAILSTLLFHGLRRQELCRLRIGDIEIRRGVQHLKVHGKGDKLRYVPMHPGTADLLDDYLKCSGHAVSAEAPLFRPVRDNRREPSANSALTANGVYTLLQTYAAAAKLNMKHVGPHSLRTTAATNALEHEADIAKVQEWLGHANIATTRMYDRRRTRPEDSPTFKVTF